MTSCFQPSRQTWLHTIITLAALLAAGLAQAQAQPPGRELLNSERIAQRFGSYGVEVLASDRRTRVSNLFSGQGESKICRTFAVVRFPASIDPAVAAEHTAILRGGSIGAVFSANGWRVLKTHLYYGEVRATPRLAALMHVAEGTSLAEHAYVLDVAKDDKTVEYAALVEIHHPAYLVQTDLVRIYGTADASQRSGLLEDLQGAVARALR
jgi:hypothetical protein